MKSAWLISSTTLNIFSVKLSIALLANKRLGLEIGPKFGAKRGKYHFSFNNFPTKTFNIILLHVKNTLPQSPRNNCPQQMHIITRSGLVLCPHLLHGFFIKIIFIQKIINN